MCPPLNEVANAGRASHSLLASAGPVAGSGRRGEAGVPVVLEKERGSPLARPDGDYWKAPANSTATPKTRPAEK